LKRCRDLLGPDAPLRQPLAGLIRRAERLADLDRKLPAVLAGKARPAGAAERAELAHLCQQPYKRLYVSSARLWREAFAAEPRLAEDPGAARRAYAAYAAALAAAGEGPEAAPLGDKQRSEWRRQALAWLRADLALFAKRAGAPGPAGRDFVREALRHWQGSPELAGLRDREALAKLPAEERDDCRKFWDEVAAQLERAGGKKR
jgi:hypothetical protein